MGSLSFHACTVIPKRFVSVNHKNEKKTVYIYIYIEAFLTKAY